MEAPIACQWSSVLHSLFTNRDSNNFRWSTYIWSNSCTVTDEFPFPCSACLERTLRKIMLIPFRTIQIATHNCTHAPTRKYLAPRQVQKVHRYSRMNENEPHIYICVCCSQRIRPNPPTKKLKAYINSLAGVMVPCWNFPGVAPMKFPWPMARAANS